MDPLVIQAFLQDPDTLARGRSCVKRELVGGFVKRDGLIEASVAGSVGKLCRVQVKLDESGHPTSAFCTCPWSAGGFFKCEHIAAVLLYDYETQGSMVNPIKEAREKVEDRVIDLRKTRGDAGEQFDVVGFLTRATGLPKETAKKR